MAFFTYTFESPAQFYAGNIQQQALVLFIRSTRCSVDLPRTPFTPPDVVIIFQFELTMPLLKRCFLYSLQLTELQDQLDGGGFHDSPESQVNAFISLLVQHQGKDNKTKAKITPGLFSFLFLHPFPFQLPLFRQSKWIRRTNKHFKIQEKGPMGGEMTTTSPTSITTNITAGLVSVSHGIISPLQLAEGATYPFFYPLPLPFIMAVPLLFLKVCLAFSLNVYYF